jgi:hypothetical protein
MACAPCCYCDAPSDAARGVPSRKMRYHVATDEEELALRASRFVRAELKPAGLTYANLRRGTFTATFLLATLAALEMEGMRLADL